MAAQPQQMQTVDPWETMGKVRALAMTEPTTDDELHAWFRICCGVNFARVPCSGMAGGCAPFDPVADLCFERVEDALILGPRDGFKTLGLACTLLYKCLFKPKIECISFGAVDYQAQKCYEYVKGFLNRTGRDLGLELDSGDQAHIGIFGAVEDGPLVEYTHVGTTKFANGSKLHIYPGTVNAVNSQHPQFTAADEVESWPWNVLMDFMGMASSGATDYLPQRVLMSVRRTATGTMNKLLREADNMHLRPYRWSILDVLQPCSRLMAECEGARCELYNDCHGRAMNATGAKPRAEVIRTRTKCDDQTWMAQHMCLKPSGSGLVYESYDPEGGHLDAKAAEYDPAKGPIYLGIDFGWGHPYCIPMCQWHDGQLSVFDCLAVKKCNTLEVKRMLVEGRWPTDPDSRDFSEVQRTFLEFGLDAQGVYVCKNVDLGYYDPSSPADGEEWLREQELNGVKLPSFRCYPAPQLNVMDGVREVRKLLRVENGRPGLVVHPRCVRLNYELSQGYLMAVDKRLGEVLDDKPVPREDDAASALRYLVQGMLGSRVGVF